MVGIYMYENKKNHKKYIGQSINITKRRRQHYFLPSQYSKIDDALHNEGLDNFIFTILEQCDAQKLDEREVYWINYYNSIEEGYNLIVGGNCYRGENNIQSKLKENEVKEIIQLLFDSDLNNSQIAKKYNVSSGTIDLINRCKTWTYLHHYQHNIRQQGFHNKQFLGKANSGARNTNSKISQLEAKNIIQLLQHDNRSLAQLARELDISLNILYDINRCKTWNYLHHYSKNIRNEARKVGGVENEEYKD